MFIFIFFKNYEGLSLPSDIHYFLMKHILCCLTVPAQACIAHWLPSLSLLYKTTTHCTYIGYIFYSPAFLVCFATGGFALLAIYLQPKCYRFEQSLIIKQFFFFFLTHRLHFVPCICLLQSLVGAWWARASACLLADPTMSGRRSWSETGSTHRLCATCCCWTTLCRRSKST